MKKILLILLVSLLLVTTISASIESLGAFKQGESINLIQNCADCSYNNITTVMLGNGTLLTINDNMQKDRAFFNLTLDSGNALSLGTYFINGIGDPSGVDTTWSYTLEVTPSGEDGNENTIFFIFVILLIYGITFTGFFGKNIPITVLGGMAMLFLGIYLVSQGIIIYRDNLTNYIAYLTIAIGGICSIWALLEQFDVL